MVTSVSHRGGLVLLLALISLFTKISISEATSSFSFSSSDKNSSFASDEIALHGNAKLVDGGSSIQMNDDSVSHGGGGLVIYKKPTLAVDTESDYFTGFSTVFSFSLSPGRIGFVMFPANGKIDHYFFQVNLDISENFTESKDSIVTVIVNGSTVSKNISDLTVVYSEKKLLYAWIYYEAISYTLHVRLSKDGRFESADSLDIGWISLEEKEDELIMGVKSYSGNFYLYSWEVGAGYSRKYEHSHLLIDEAKWREEDRKKEEAKKRRRERMRKIVTCFVMPFGFTGLVFFAIMCIWAAFKRNKLAMVIPEECGLKMEKLEFVTSKVEAKQERK